MSCRKWTEKQKKETQSKDDALIGDASRLFEKTKTISRVVKLILEDGTLEIQFQETKSKCGILTGLAVEKIGIHQDAQG